MIQGGGCFITDFGLCGPVDEKSSSKIYGIVSYIAPELLRGTINAKNTKETDVYSVGMLMWEIFAGHPLFDDRAHNHCLIFDICEKGLQPPILPNMPEDYAQMMQKCWDVDPSKRPTIGELWDFAYEKSKEINNNSGGGKKSTSLIKRLFKLSKTKKNELDFNSNINSSGGGSSSNSLQIHKTHSLAYHTSRILDDEIAKSKSLKSNNSSLNDLDINMLTLT